MFFSTSSNIQSYNTANSSEGPTIFANHSEALLSFDGINKRLYSYTEGERITSYDLDGSNSSTTDVDNVEFFTVDGQNNVIYYHHSSLENVQMYDIASGQSTPINTQSSVKDLDMDTTNGYVILSSP